MARMALRVREVGVLRSLHRIFELLGSEKPGRWLALAVGALLVSVLEMVGALLVFLLLALISDPSGGLQVPLFGDLRRFFGDVAHMTFLLWAAAAMASFFVVRMCAQVGFAYLKQRVAHNAAARLSSKLTRGYLRLPYAFHLRRSSAELVRNAHQNLENLAAHSFLAATLVVAELILVAGLVTVMIIVAPLAAILAALVVGTASMALLAIVQPALQRLGARAQDARRRTLGLLQQSLHGIRDIKVLARESYFASAYAQDRGRLARSLYLRGAALELPRLVIETSLVFFILLLFGFSVAAGMASHELLSTLGLFAYAGLRIQPSLQKLVSGLNSVRFSSSAVEEVLDDLRLIDRLEAEPARTATISFKRDLRLEDVSFDYEGSSRPAITNVDLSIAKGELIGICGPSGGGKTTLVDLIVGLLDPSSGRVRVDGTDVNEARDSWFRMLGVVPQMIFLLDDTLRRNIALGVPDGEVDEKAVLEAAQVAQLEETISRLPDGLDTVVGERGVRLSGGQRQRVAIARALYRRPEVLVFDEGTSALDTGTESVLISALECLRGQHTIILVAHRLSTVRGCDRIAYVDNGRVAGVGRFDELERENAGFKELAQDT